MWADAGRIRDRRAFAATSQSGRHAGVPFAPSATGIRDWGRARRQFEISLGSIMCMYV
jgi:hypothetical protein